MKKLAIEVIKGAQTTKPAGGYLQQSLYKLDPPFKKIRYVVVSASEVFGKPETYIFKAKKNGEVTSWLEMEGSFKGDLCHRKALAGIGYKIVEKVLV